MTHSIDVLLVSRKKEALDTLEQHLRGAGVSVRRQMNTNGHVDPLHDVEKLPDVLDPAPQPSVARGAGSARGTSIWNAEPRVIVVGASSDMGMMRLAMQAGARDLLPEPVVKADLLASASSASSASSRRTADRSHRRRSQHSSTRKGGCGATLLACNVAHMLAAESKKRTALLDLDLQFGAAPLYLDLFPQARRLRRPWRTWNGSTKSRSKATSPSTPAACTFSVMALTSRSRRASCRPSAVDRLLDVALRSHDHLIVDLPRRVDGVLATVVQRAQQVVVVLQQSVTALRDATRLVQWLRTEGGVAQGPAVRRRQPLRQGRFDLGWPTFRRRSAATSRCWCRTTSDWSPNASTAALPLLDHARGAAITKAVMTLETRLGGAAARPRSGVLARTFSNLLSGRA